MARTFAAIGKHFGVAAATVSYWKSQGAPIARGGENELDKIAAWRREWDATRGRAERATGSEELRRENLAAKTDRERTRAALDRLRLNQIEGRLVDAGEIEAAFAVLVVGWRDQIRGRLVDLLLLRLPEELRVRLAAEITGDVERFLAEIDAPNRNRPREKKPLKGRPAKRKRA